MVGEPDAMTPEMCKYCRFWEAMPNPMPDAFNPATFEPSVGICHRFPPTPSPIPVSSSAKVYALYPVGMMPYAMAHNWCGEFAPPSTAS